MNFFSTFFDWLLFIPGPRPLSIYSNDDQGSVYQNCKFHDPWDRGHISHKVKMLDFHLKNLFCAAVLMDQTMMIKEWY